MTRHWLFEPLAYEIYCRQRNNAHFKYTGGRSYTPLSFCESLEAAMSAPCRVMESFTIMEFDQDATHLKDDRSHCEVK